MRVAIVLAIVVIGLDVHAQLPPPTCSPVICFSPGGKCDDPVISLIGMATKRVDVAAYSLTRQPIIDALVQAMARGVAVRILVDAVQARGVKMARVMSGIERRERGNRFRLMHLKMIVVDDIAVVSGSMNFTDGGVLRNDEIMRIDCNADLAVRFRAEFEKRWAK